MRRNLLIFNFVSLILLFSSCEKTKLPVLPQDKALQLEVAEAGVTEAWLQVKIGVKEPGQQLRLYRQGELVQQLSVDRDTVLYDSGLAPAHSYTYHTELWKSGTRLGKTNSVTLTTMDTTSHDFQWEIITFGTGGSSILRDVAIINENDIWAVGIIGESGGPYNAVHWNGEKWELKRIFYYYQGSAFIRPIPSVFAFNENDVWFGNFTHWNGTTFESIELNIEFPSQINQFWGRTKNDLYIVGNNGLIAYYDGQRWRRIESGTELPIQDIWGVKDYETGEDYILCSASDKFHASEKKILRIKSDYTISEIFWPFSNRDPYSVWFKSPNEIYISGGGVIKRNFNGEYKIFDELPRIFINRIRGNNINDIFVAGDFGMFAHYNGLDWWVHPNTFYGTFLSIDVKKNTIVAVGEQNTREALIMVLKR